MDIVEIGAGIHTIYVDDECLLFSEPRQEIHALNTSAAFIWCHLQDGRTPEDIAAQLRDTFNLAETDARCFVETALADWRALGFLADSPVQERPSAAPPAESRSDLPACQPAAFVAERCYSILSSRLRIRFTAPEHVAVVHPVLAHLESGDGQADTVLDVVETEGRIVLYRDGVGCADCSSDDELAPMVKGLVWSTAANRHDFFLGIHAGVVGGPDGVMLLPGKPGSGKSSLTAALVYAGHDYFSDEMALLRDGDLHVVPMPLSLCVKDQGIAVLAVLFPELRELPVHRRADGKRVAYLRPPPDRLPLPGAARPVRTIVFPGYVAGAETTCRALPKTEALRRLMEQCLVVRGPLDIGRVRALLNLIDKVSCFELVFGAVLNAAAVASDLLRDARQSAVGEPGVGQAVGVE